MNSQAGEIFYEKMPDLTFGFYSAYPRLKDASITSVKHL